MITVNSIILSVLIGSMYPRLQEYPQLLWGLGPIVIADVLSIIFAVLATRPVVAKGEFSREDVQNKNACLNTFYNFYKMSWLPGGCKWDAQRYPGNPEFLY